MTICSVKGCDGYHIAKGYCDKHYRRYLTYGDPLGKAEPKEKRICMISGCDNYHYAHGYCKKHDRRVRNNGDPYTVKKTGRSTTYEDSYCDLAYKFVMLGHTIEELATYLDVTVSTIYNWRDAHPSFMEAIKNGRIEADMHVENALYRSAKGYNEDGKHYPPNPASIIFWLKNRHPDRWNNRNDYEKPRDPNEGKTLNDLKSELEEKLTKLNSLIDDESASPD